MHALGVTHAAYDLLNNELLDELVLHCTALPQNMLLPLSIHNVVYGELLHVISFIRDMSEVGETGFRSFLVVHFLSKDHFRVIHDDLLLFLDWIDLVLAEDARTPES